MVPLTILISTYLVARLALRRTSPPKLPMRLALAVMLLATGVTHFAATRQLAAMVPSLLPSPVLIVHATGVVELVFALLLLARPSPALGWTLAAFFAALLPANIYSAVEGVGMGAHGVHYLWFRVPLQLLFIGWALRSCGTAGMVRSGV